MKYTYAVGRRKTASAQVRLYEGSKDSKINEKMLNEYVKRDDLFDTLFAPLRLCWVKDNYFFEVKVSGSGDAAQVDAIKLGLARALAEKDAKFKAILKEAGLLTRDARKVERKKPGRHKARKAMQWSKR